ncbi:hypothetical protein FRC12_009738 [Ceratobasidium sp. 428]|nr:hypothetical protein FRC12_009738 [Ceratobasidium sp. 428]
MDVELSSEQCEKLVCEALGYKKLEEWQLTAINTLRSGKDVFAIAPTGAGKSTVIQSAVLIDQACGIESMALVLVPTKSLGNDQTKRLRALALHADTLTQADTQRPRRDLFNEIKKGEWTHVYLGPEMVTEDGFGDLIIKPDFTKRLRYFTVNEAHITTEWDYFRNTFAHVARLRNRLQGRVPWLALSATVEPTREFQLLVDSLGFDVDRTELIRLPVDRSSLSYSPRFLQYAWSENQTESLDVSFVIPQNMERAKDIEITLKVTEVRSDLLVIRALKTKLVSVYLVNNLCGPSTSSRTSL